MQTLYELGALANARNYQKWMFEAVAPFLGNRILELGSGIGNLSRWLPKRELLILSDVEQEYVDRLRQDPVLQNDQTRVVQLDLGKPMREQFAGHDLDTIVSFNVMEHIEDDLGCFAEQVAILKTSKSAGPKRIVVFVPALQFAFGALDREFRHFRRYQSSDLRRIFRKIDPALQVRCRYFNLLSLIPWIVQGRLLGNTRIKDSQVSAFEKVVPIWQPLDTFLTGTLRVPLGQSLIGIAEI